MSQMTPLALVLPGLLALSSVSEAALTLTIRSENGGLSSSLAASATGSTVSGTNNTWDTAGVDALTNIESTSGAASPFNAIFASGADSLTYLNLDTTLADSGISITVGAQALILNRFELEDDGPSSCLLYTSPSPRDRG